MLPQILTPTREDQVPDIRSAQDLLEHAYKPRHQRATLDDMTLHDDGTVEFVPIDGQPSRLPFAQPFLESLARDINMPLNYAYDIPFGLFRENFDQRKQPRTRGLTLCIVRDTVVNTAPDDYEQRRASSIKILDSLDFLDDAWLFETASLSDEGMSVSLLHSGDIVEPKPGDVICAGIRITNSETGGRYAKAGVYTKRLVCSNGAVMPDSTGVAWWNSDKRMHETTKHDVFRKRIAQLLQTAAPATVATYAGVTDRPILQRQLAHLFRRLNYVLHSAEQVDRILGIPTADRVRIQTHVRDLEPGDFGEPTPWSVFDLHNRVTAGAREITSSSRRSRFSLQEHLEEIGGDLLLFGRN
jgi:hypothetical protein